jgi:hypothetical protein
MSGVSAWEESLERCGNNT